MNLEKEIFDISLQDIIPNRFQPREMFDDNALQELSQSIREHGVIQPIIVRKVGDKYEIIAGERRYRASQLAGKETIPALVRDIDDKEAAKIALLENLQRSNLTPIEEAKTYQTILKLDNITQEELAQNLGKSQSTIANKLRLLTLDEEVQTALLNSQISERHARSLIGLDYTKQNELLHRILNEKLTVRQLDEEIMRLTGKMPEGEQQETIGVPNLSEGRISMDIAQNPVVQAPVVDTPTFNEPPVVPVVNNPVIEQMPQAPVQTLNQPNLQTDNFSNFNNPINIPNVQDINNASIGNIPMQEPLEKTINQEQVQEVKQPEINETPFQGQNELNIPMQEEPIIKSEEIPKENIFDKLRVQNNEPINPEPITQPVNNSEFEKLVEPSTIINSEITQDTKNQNFNNIYDLRFAINNFRQAIQNTEKFGFKVKADEYDSPDKYQIVIEIDKKN